MSRIIFCLAVALTSIVLSNSEAKVANAQFGGINVKKVIDNAREPFRRAYREAPKYTGAIRRTPAIPSYNFYLQNTTHYQILGVVEYLPIGSNTWRQKHVQLRPGQRLWVCDTLNRYVYFRGTGGYNRRRFDMGPVFNHHSLKLR